MQTTHDHEHIQCTWPSLQACNNNQSGWTYQQLQLQDSKFQDDCVNGRTKRSSITYCHPSPFILHTVNKIKRLQLQQEQFQKFQQAYNNKSKLTEEPKPNKVPKPFIKKLWATIPAKMGKHISLFTNCPSQAMSYILPVAIKASTFISKTNVRSSNIIHWRRWNSFTTTT